MSEVTIPVKDYDGERGTVWVGVQEPNWSNDNMVRLSVKDHDANSIVYLDQDQAKAVVLGLLEAMREVKHGPS